MIVVKAIKRALIEMVAQLRNGCTD